jgi:hypothetical protein
VINGGQPKAAIFGRQAKESGNWEASQSRDQTKTSSVRQMRITEHHIDPRRAQQLAGRSYIVGEVASESPSAQLVRQGLSAMKTLSNQQHVLTRDCH